MNKLHKIIAHSLINADDTLDTEFDTILNHRTIISPPLSPPVSGPSWLDFEGAGAYLTDENSTVIINPSATNTELQGGSTFDDMLDAPDSTATLVNHDQAGPSAWGILVQLPTSKLGNIPFDPVSITAAITHKGTGQFAFSNYWALVDLPTGPPRGATVNMTINSGVFVTEDIIGADADWPPTAATINANNGLAINIAGFTNANPAMTEIDAVNITIGF